MGVLKFVCIFFFLQMLIMCDNRETLTKRHISDTDSFMVFDLFLCFVPLELCYAPELIFFYFSRNKEHHNNIIFYFSFNFCISSLDVHLKEKKIVLIFVSIILELRVYINSSYYVIANRNTK